MTKENTTASLTPKSFLHKVLNGTAIGVIVALLPNCIFAIIFSLDFFKNNAFFATWNVANVLFQATLSAVIGTLVALEFNFKGMKSCASDSHCFC
ncbi:PTS sugar transporter subunit IIC [Streptococcus anginosus]|nr:PTS sugar transporter subunit IIC [Streptococcus anginosus]